MVKRRGCHDVKNKTPCKNDCPMEFFGGACGKEKVASPEKQIYIGVVHVMTRDALLLLGETRVPCQKEAWGWTLRGRASKGGVTSVTDLIMDAKKSKNGAGRSGRVKWFGNGRVIPLKSVNLARWPNGPNGQYIMCRENTRYSLYF